MYVSFNVFQFKETDCEELQGGQKGNEDDVKGKCEGEKAQMGVVEEKGNEHENTFVRSIRKKQIKH